jgi:hypothetical protein
VQETQLIVVLACLLFLMAIGHTSSERRWTLAQFWLWMVIAWPLLIKLVALPVAGAHGPPLSDNVTLLLTYSPTFCIGMIILAKGFLQRSMIYVPTVGLLFISILGFAYFSGSIGGQVSLLSFVWLAPLLLKLDLDVTMLKDTVRRSVASLLIGMAIAAVLVPEVVLTPCRSDKCGLTSYVYSPDGLGNALGLAIALLIPVSLIALPRKRLLAGAVGLSAVIAVSDTRSSVVAVILGLGFCFVTSFHQSRTSLNSGRFIAIFGLGASLLPVLVPFSSDAFTGRGALWEQARSIVEMSPLLGVGPSFWVNQIRTVNFAANYSPHNIWWESLVAVGFIGTTLLVLSVVLGVTKLPRASRALVYAQIGIVLSASVTEAPLAVHRLGVAPFTHLLLISLLMASGTKMKESRGRRRTSHVPNFCTDQTHTAPDFSVERPLLLQ